MPEAVGKKGPSNLTVRVATALILGPLLLLLLFFGPTWSWSILVAAAAAQVSRELLAMTHPQDPPSRFIGALMTAALSAAIYFAQGDVRIILSAVLATLIVGALLPLFRLGSIDTAALRLLGGSFAPLYVGGLLSTLALLRRDAGQAGARYVLFALLIAWAADTGGYAAGRLFGKTKLYEAVSPKKTREGLVGSILLSMLGTGLASLTYLPQIPLASALALGGLGAILGQMGDLVESLLKRSTGVKDSGSILPGHGGLFDRVDALLIVGPMVYLYFVWSV